MPDNTQLSHVTIHCKHVLYYLSLQYERSRAFISSDRFWGAYQKMDCQATINSCGVPIVGETTVVAYIAFTYIYTNISASFGPVFSKVLEYAEVH